MSTTWWLDTKNNRENYLRKCVWIQERETWLKFNLGLSAHRPSNNWSQDDQSWALSETVQNISKITHTASRFSFLLCELSVRSSVWMNCNRVTLQHNNEFIIIIFCFLMVSVITMCNYKAFDTRDIFYYSCKRCSWTMKTNATDN